MKRKKNDPKNKSSILADEEFLEYLSESIKKMSVEQKEKGKSKITEIISAIRNP